MAEDDVDLAIYGGNEESRMRYLIKLKKQLAKSTSKEASMARIKNLYDQVQEQA